MRVAETAPGVAVSADAAWAELNLHLERSKGFCLVFVYADGAYELQQLRTRLSDGWAWRTAPLQVIRLETPARAAGQVTSALEVELSAHTELRAPVWLELTEIDAHSSNAWEAARHDVLYRLNEWRSWLQGSFRRPLVIALPASWRGRLNAVAPDLWHVRTMSVQLSPTSVAGAAGAIGAPSYDLHRTLGALGGPEGLEAADSAFDEALDAGRTDEALALAQRLVEQHRLNSAGGDSPGVLRDLAVSLINLGDAQRQAGQGAEALAAYRESLAIDRELRQRLGDSPEVLRDLALSLNKLGDAQRQAGQGAEALAAYRESLAIDRELHQQVGDSPAMLDDLAISLQRLASQAAIDPGVPAAERRAWLAEALRYRRRLAQAFAHDENWQARLRALEQLAKTLEKD